MGQAGYVLMVLTAVTGILVMPLAYLSALSGLCMKNPALVGALTLGLFEDYGMCTYLHLDYTPQLLAVVAVLHTVLSLQLLAQRIPAEHRMYRLVLDAYTLLAIALGTHLIITLLAVYYMS